VRVFAHRGDTSSAPENTIGAFLAAIRAGAHGVELDVRRSADGALVVHHDATVPGMGPVSDLDVRDLPRSVALLDEALTALEPIAVNVEIKNEPTEPGFDPTGSISHDVVALLEERGDLERVIVSSFDLATLDAVRQANPSVATGWLLGYEVAPLAALSTALEHGFGAIHPFVLALDATAVEAAHAAGLDVNTWTVNARHDLERMAAIGVDVVITDAVALALDVARTTPTARNGVSALPPLE
jgi:glycerophosphoryl diester phosphodiesterase